jgi:hypothetical protein
VSMGIASYPENADTIKLFCTPRALYAMKNKPVGTHAASVSGAPSLFESSAVRGRDRALKRKVCIPSRQFVAGRVEFSN